MTDLYRFFDDAGDLLYVGVSLHAAQRASSHRAGQPWWPEAVKMTIEHHDTRDAALAAELVAIRTEHPRHNVIGRQADDRRPAPAGGVNWRCKSCGGPTGTPASRGFVQLDGWDMWECVCDECDRLELLDDMIADFPLATASDRAHVLALILTSTTRHLVPLVPLFAFDGNGPGVGKNLLSECCAYIATGEWAQTDPLPLDSEEQRKQITAMMATGRSVAIFDEAHIISGTSLARLITSTTWGDRLLGYSKQVSYPNRLTVVALGNNVEIQGDMPRRTILIRLASSVARPELRTGFRHDNLRAWVEQHRTELLSAALTIMRAWVVAGRPTGGVRLGSFDAWADMIGGALAVAGVEGFLANIDEMRSRGATDDSDMTDHLLELRSHFGSFPFLTADVAALLSAGRLETWPPRVANDERRMAAQIGYAYRRHAERWFGDLMLSSSGRGHNNVRRWTLVTKPQELGGDGGDGGDGTSFARNELPETQLNGDGRKASPPSPPSPPSASLPSAATQGGHDEGPPMLDFEDVF